ncbi:IclR family transcriptional regulator C-terminal domain-containing protein [Streptomyces fagopyri]|uniref:IclR family transcriptional regulator domain-containing protein n=1 Tax=Streptomyces fagopyri TaxID=2662397 RepID=UPI0036B3A40D
MSSNIGAAPGSGTGSEQAGRPGDEGGGEGGAEGGVPVEGGAEGGVPVEGGAEGGVPVEAVTPLIRGIAVLRRLTESDGVSSLSGLERSTGLARSTVDRITATLARGGYVRLDGRDAVLAPRLMELGNAYLAALRLPRLLDAHADALADALDESVSLAVGDQDGVRFIHQATRRRAMSLSFRIGDLLPAERTAPGPLFATEWGEREWARWRERRAADPEDRGFPAVPARSRPIEADPERRDGSGAPYADRAPGTAPVLTPGGNDGHRPATTDDGRRTATDDGGIVPPVPPVPAVRPVGQVGPDARQPPVQESRPPVQERGPLTTLGDDFETRTAEAREDGWALDDQLIEPGLVAIAMPVREAGRIACVVSVVSHTSRHTAADLRDTLLPRLRTAVTAMERELSETPPDAPAVTATPSGLAVWTGACKQELGREFVESLARGLMVITAFGEGRSELTLTDVARATGLARATARRALITLEHLGYVTAHARVFRLTPRVLGLGFPPLSRTSLPEIAAPHLTGLSQRLHESVSLAVLTEDEIQYTARIATSRILSVHISVGTRLPAYATSLGRVMLADLPEPPPTELRPLTPRTITDPGRLKAVLDRVREDGYAFVDAELEEGLRSIAVPVRERGGRVVAAVNVAMHSSRRTSAQCVDEVLPELLATAGSIEADLRVAGRFRQVPGM